MFLNDKLKINTYKLPDNKLFKVFDECEDNYMTDLFELYSIQNNTIYDVKNSTLKDLRFNKGQDYICVINGIYYSDRFLSSSFNSEIWSEINYKRLNLNMKLKKIWVINKCLYLKKLEIYSNVNISNISNIYEFNTYIKNHKYYMTDRFELCTLEQRKYISNHVDPLHVINHVAMHLLQIQETEEQLFIVQNVNVEDKTWEKLNNKRLNLHKILSKTI